MEKSLDAETSSALCGSHGQQKLPTIKINEFKNAYVRLLVTRGDWTFGLSPWICETPNIIIIADTIELFKIKK